MIRIVTLFLVSVAVFSKADQISYNTCYYPDAADGPSTANLIKTDNGFELEVKFWANEIGQNSPLKIKLHGSDYNSVIRLVHVSYPVSSPADNKYTEHKLTVPIPKMEINSDKVQVSLHKVSNNGTETPVWCMMTSVRVLNGMEDEPVPTMPTMPIHPPIPISAPMNNVGSAAS